MTIRPLVAANAALFQALRLRGLLECPTAFASSHAEEVNLDLATVAQRITARADRAIFGAFDASALVAIVGVQREAMVKLAHKAFLWGVYVAPEARGQGVGARLLQHALGYAAASLKVRQVKLGVNTGNEAAIALYERLGFVTYGVERGYLLVDGVLHDECQMVATIQSRE